MTRKNVLVIAGSCIVIGCVVAFFVTRNRPPVAADVQVATDEGVPIAMNPLANAHDPDGDPLTLAELSPPEHGFAEKLPDGRVNYSPALGFFGEDRFTYKVEDGRGGSASAQVRLTVRLKPPVFLRRSRVATLSEMLQQPPTSIFGSSISVYAYGDDEDYTELAVTGHADARTCGLASGLIANALLGKGLQQGDFLVAGAGRLARQRNDDSAGDAETPEVRAWINALYRKRLLMLSEKPVPEELLATIAQLETDPGVRRYRNDIAAGKLLGDTVAQLDELAGSSGLLRVVKLPSSLPDAVRKRITDAVAVGKPSVVRFDDLLTEAHAPEAALFVPMLDTRTGAPVVLDIALPEFSADGFAEAAKEQRDALETAMVGNARARIQLADEKLRDGLRDSERCAKLTESQLKEQIRPNQVCTADGCYVDHNAPMITRRKYCEVQVPKNKDIAEQWKRSAQALLVRLDSEREARGGTVDVVTHAAVIDSMLRDWALPVHGRQAAFDHWRKNRRTAAWEAVIRALIAIGIDRRVLEGENVVLPASATGDRIRISPMLAVDLRRSIVVIEPRLGAITILDAWAERRSEPVAETLAGTANLGADADRLRRAIATDPASAVNALLDNWSRELPTHAADTEKRARQGEKVVAAEKGRELISFFQSFAASDLNTWNKYGGALQVALTRPEATVEARLLAALALARGVAAIDGSSDPWALLRGARGGQRPAIPEKSPLHEALDDDPGTVMVKLLQKAVSEDASLVDQALAEGGLPARQSARATAMQELLNTPSSALDLDVAEGRSIRRALARRAYLLDAVEMLVGDAGLGDIVIAIDRAASAGEADQRQDELRTLSRYVGEQAKDAIGLRSIGRIEIANELQHMSEGLIAQAKLEEKSVPIRFGAERERLRPRIAYEDAAYARALVLAFPTTLPVGLYHPDIRWEVSESQPRGAYAGLRARETADGLLIAANQGGAWIDALRIKLPACPDRDALATEVSKAEGSKDSTEPVAESILRLELPLRPSLAAAYKGVQDTGARLSILKAIVYACGIPAADLVSRPSECDRRGQPRGGITEGAGGGAEKFEMPDLDELVNRVPTRFAALNTAPKYEDGWRKGQIHAR